MHALRTIPSTPAVRRSSIRPRAEAPTRHVCPPREELQRRPTQQLVAVAATALVALNVSLSALAGDSNVISEFKTSGLIFKDTVQVLELKDPEIQGVTIYYTDYTRSITEKLTSKEDAFSDPSQSSIACTVTGNPAFTAGDASAISGREGKEIFAELKALNPFQNKQTRIRRIYNPESGDVIYVSYNTRNTRSADEGGVSSSRYRTSMCAVHVG